MFDIFKKPVRVYCADTNEMGRLLQWLRANQGLIYATKNTWEVKAILPGPLNKDQSVRGFWVEVPYELAAPRFKSISEQEAFADILAGI